MPNDFTFRILIADLDAGKGEYRRFGDKRQILGGSGLSAALYAEFGKPQLPALDPSQPLIFAIGPLTGCFPMMSKVVCAFKSPYNEQFAESHAGGRMALAMRFAHIDALVIVGRAASLSSLSVGLRQFEVRDAHFLKGLDVFTTGKMLRKGHGGGGAGHRSIARIGPAGENLSAYACINVDSYRHFGRLGAGAVMGAKNLKGLIIDGGSSMPAPEGKAYPDQYKEIYEMLTATTMMRKYHNLGTAENLSALNELKSLPWRNLQATSDPAVEGISGERFAKDLLLRKAACTGCPVGCIHVGLLREQFAKDNDFLYRQVSYDYEPIFSAGTMLGMKDASDVLAILDEIERVGLDSMSAGVALAWATEALEKGAVTEAETLVPLRFGEAIGYRKAVEYLGTPPNEFYRLLAQGSMVAAKHYNGQDYACVLGQEMAGYATGEVFFVSQALGFRHSHLDCGGYSYDQKSKEKDVGAAITFMLEDERQRCGLTSMVSCLFARSVYTEEMLGKALDSIGLGEVAANLHDASAAVQRLRWKNKFATGFDPEAVKIPKRYLEVVTWKGPIDGEYLQKLKDAYAAEIRKMSQ